MNNPITITATVGAWLYSFNSPASMLNAIADGKAERAISMLAYYGSPDQETFGDHMRVGEADITLRLFPRDEQTRLAVEALKAKADKLRAAYMTAQQEILDQISNLQAIEYVEA